ncbi:hypothetical protein EU803_02755 [Loktanella sp. IMCC34160]|uniref:hypothetical protein n=1 Tax=Loktanella sp. IMCC34160 TaxID=2510646 RepID=UPI00101E187E|nr:hypothetical protein [Loktanella sp. IMCC34160]RYG93044.1 hypothetical protein EU803_02755 [Loktanella sp. IMCC34160]
MSEFDDLAKTLEERRRIFSPGWFQDLLAGRLGLGDTFWIGNYGVGLIFVPAAVLLPMLPQLALGPRALTLSSGFLTAGLTLYLAALTRAVFIRARATPQVGGWRWVGVAFTLCHCALAGLVAMIYLLGA